MTEYILSGVMITIAMMVLLLIKDLNSKSHKHIH